MKLQHPHTSKHNCVVFWRTHSLLIYIKNNGDDASKDTTSCVKGHHNVYMVQ